MCIKLFEFIYYKKEGIEAHLYFFTSCTVKYPLSVHIEKKLEFKTYWILYITIPFIATVEFSRFGK